MPYISSKKTEQSKNVELKCTYVHWNVENNIGSLEFSLIKAISTSNLVQKRATIETLACGRFQLENISKKDQTIEKYLYLVEQQQWRTAKSKL